jgi:hypothetical protein
VIEGNIPVLTEQQRQKSLHRVTKTELDGAEKNSNDVDKVCKGRQTSLCAAAAHMALRQPYQAPSVCPSGRSSH